jgi:uncharacterized cysteine cluster protein YcgN (CxxCxxCC family)
MKEKSAFWKNKKLAEMSSEEWEQLCDGCAKCCLHKLENEDTGEVHYTRVACRLLNIETCRCSNYPNRHTLIPECAHLSAKHPEYFAWLPETCAYRRIYEGRPLPDWHPLITGTVASAQPQRACEKFDLIPEHLAEEFLNSFPEQGMEIFIIEEQEKPI